MRKLLLLLFVFVTIIVTSCQPKIDPVQPTYEKAVVVQVWWTVQCKYCRQQVAILQEVKDEIASTWIGENVEIALINPFDSGEEIVAFLQENGYTFEVATVPAPPKANGVPIMVISVEGQEPFQAIGVIGKEDLLKVLRGLLIEGGIFPPQGE